MGSRISFSRVAGGLNRKTPLTMSGSVSSDEYVFSWKATTGSRCSFSRATNCSTVHSGRGGAPASSGGAAPADASPATSQSAVRPIATLGRPAPKFIKVEPVVRGLTSVDGESIGIALRPASDVRLVGTGGNAHILAQ